MIQKVVVIVLVAAAVIGLVFYLRKEQQSSCDGGCPECPLRDGCNKKKLLDNEKDTASADASADAGASR